MKFVEHFFWIAAAMNRAGRKDGMWDEEDGFYYDVLRLPDGSATRLKVRSMVGLLPLCATTVIEEEQRETCPACLGAAHETHAAHARACWSPSTPPGPGHFGVAERGILALVNPERLRRILSQMLDENEFLSPYGIRSLSRYHARAPLRLPRTGPGVPGRLSAGRVGHRHVRRQLQLARPDLVPRERADHPGAAAVLPLLRRQLQDRVPHRFGKHDEPLRGEPRRSPTASLASSSVTSTAIGRSYGGTEKFQTDPHWRDHILFYEYFHGDNGAGLGATHQTGWTGLVAKLIELYGYLDPVKALAAGKEEAFRRGGSAGKSKK